MKPAFLIAFLVAISAAVLPDLMPRMLDSTKSEIRRTLEENPDHRKNIASLVQKVVEVSRESRQKRPTAGGASEG